MKYANVVYLSLSELLNNIGIDAGNTAETPAADTLLPMKITSTIDQGIMNSYNKCRKLLCCIKCLYDR